MHWAKFSSSDLIASLNAFVVSFADYLFNSVCNARDFIDKACYFNIYKQFFTELEIP